MGGRSNLKEKCVLKRRSSRFHTHGKLGKGPVLMPGKWHLIRAAAHETGLRRAASCTTLEVRPVAVIAEARGHDPDMRTAYPDHRTLEGSRCLPGRGKAPKAGARGGNSQRFTRSLPLSALADPGNRENTP